MPHLPHVEVPRIEALVETGKRYPELDPLATATFLHVLITSDELFRGASKVFLKHNVSKGKFMLLMQLFDKRDGTTRKRTPAQLAENMDVTRATITGLLDGLERDEMIVRERDENDKRMVLVGMTQKGLAFMDMILPQHFKNLQTLMGGLTDDEKHQLRDLLFKIGDHVQREYPSAPGSCCGCTEV